MHKEISVEQLSELPRDTYMVIDIRDETAFSYGHIDDAINIPHDQILSAQLPREKTIILCCKSGIVSAEDADTLCAQGYDAANLTGGYVAWLRKELACENRAAEVERSIQTKFSRSIWSKFAKAIAEYRLVNAGDKIAVCISGGKDSMLMAKLFQELKRHNKVPFELVFLVMDPGYSPENRAIIEENARMLSIPIQVFETNIFESVYHVQNNPCYLCARMRRGHLYNQAQKLGCNKIALGHHYDDVIETILMGMIYGGQAQTMMPKLHSENFEGMQLIRPMYFVREEDICRWRDYNHLHFIQCACKFTDTCTTCTPSNTGSKRQEIKKLIAYLKKDNPQIEQNIFHSMEKVKLRTVISYKDMDGEVHHFLDTYED